MLVDCLRCQRDNCQCDKETALDVGEHCEYSAKLQNRRTPSQRSPPTGGGSAYYTTPAQIAGKAALGLKGVRVWDKPAKSTLVPAVRQGLTTTSNDYNHYGQRNKE